MREHDLAKDLRFEIRELKMELKNDIALLEHRMTIKLGTIVCIGLGAAVALTKIL